MSIINNNTILNATGAAVPYTTGNLINHTYNYTTPSYSIDALSATYTSPATQGSLRVMGTAEFEGDVKIKGVSLDERLNAIEDRLCILRPNNDLEGKWEKLKKLGEEYRELERELLEQEKVWDILKK